MTDRPKTIAEAIELVCEPHLGEVLSRSFIAQSVAELMGCPPDSVMPSDHCYNRTNAGVTTQQPMFVMLDRASYRYVGRAAQYTGECIRYPKGGPPVVVGDWIDGAWHPRPARANDHTANVSSASAPDSSLETAQATAERMPLSLEQIERLYDLYRRTVEIEVADFRCPPTENTHLIGRLGELYAARKLRGTLATRTNQHGFDVISADKRRVSVKTTAQDPATFVSFNPRTLEHVDAVVILRFSEGEFEVVYEGSVDALRPHFRQYEDKLEIDIVKAARVTRDLGRLTS